MRFHVLTLFPEAFGQPLQFSIVGRAVQRGQVAIDVTDIRDYAHDVHALPTITNSAAVTGW